MNKKNQLLLLSLMLIFPLFIFLLLKYTGKNVYSLEVMNPGSPECPPNMVDGVHRVPDFALTNAEGKAFGTADLHGKIYVADFFFTRCGSICPVMTSELTRVQEEFKDHPDIMLVSYTVDPEYDSAAVLGQYAQAYKAQAGKWHFVTGAKKAIYDLALCGYYILARDRNDTDTTNDLFIHSDKVVLVDRQQRIRGYYSGTDRKDIDRLIIEIKVLLKEEAQ
jgi:protein SCO1